jgi:hypothetical protein
MAGIKPEMLGRKAFSDRDAAARDTVYRKPPARAARKETTSSTKKSSGGGGGHKKSGGDRPKRPQKAPAPSPNTTLGGTPTAGYGSPSTFPARPETVAPQMPQMPPPLDGLPPELQDVNFGPGGTPLDPGNMRGRPDPLMPPPPSPTNPSPYPPVGPGGTPLDPGNMRGRPDPLMPPPAGPENPGGMGGAMSLKPRVPGPGRAELAGLLAGGSGKGPTPDENPYAVPDWLKRMFGG